MNDTAVASRCARSQRGIRCERPATFGIPADGDTLWLCGEHLTELLLLRTTR